MSRTAEITPQTLDGLLIVDKPKGWTSMEVNRRVKHILSIKKIGHLGTLDPIATGVLPLFLGRATRLIPYFETGDKEYLIRIQFGIETDTWDADGKVVARVDRAVQRDQVDLALRAFLGEQEQVAPPYSAKKVEGKRFYEIAREGGVVPERKAKIEVHAIRLDSFDEHAQAGDVFISCSKGTYTRSIAHMLGKQLGVGAMQQDLRRISTGPFRLDVSHSIHAIENALKASHPEKVIVPLHQILSVYGN